MRRVPVTRWLGGENERPATGPGHGTITGVLVHRLLQASTGGLLTEDDARRRLEALLRPDERAVTVNFEGLRTAVLAAWARVLEREDLHMLFARSRILAEVPFSLRSGDAAGEPVLLRGTIDCVALTGDSDVTVIELKTGAPREIHPRQLELYLRAARELFAGRTVTGLLIHA